MGFEKTMDAFEHEKQRIGSQQNATGKMRNRFSEKFLEQFGQDDRKLIESLIKDVHQNTKNLARFRSRMILALAISYNTGVLAARKGTGVNVLGLIKEAANEVAEEVPKP